MHVDPETEVPETESQPDDGNLDTIISNAIAKAEVPADEKAPAATPALDTEAESGERQRDPATGRFLPKDTAAAPAPDKGTAGTAATPAQTTDAKPADTQPLEAPSRWSEADKAAFAKMPREAQAVILERNKAMEADYTRKTQELAETRKTVEPVVQELSKWNPYLQQLGIAPHQAIGQMLTVEYNLRTGTPEQKAQALAYLAELYGVAPTPNGGEPAKAADPLSQQLSRQVATLTQELQQIKSQSAQSERQRAEAEFNALGQTKDSNGQPKYPHFERVRQSMIQLVATGQADSWDAAYSKSVRLDDELYNQTVEEERKRVLAEQDKQRQEAIEKANKAKPVKTSSALPRGETKSTDLDSIISGAMAKAGI